jgi:hypothetical protein
MFGFHVEVQGLFLKKCLVAMFAFVGIHAGMFLQMVMHRILPLIRHRAMGAYIETLRIFLVCNGIRLDGHGH